MGAMEPKQRTVQCLSPRGLHKIAFLEWGDPSNSKVLICAHGLTRCARDFDALAAAMADRYRVICPDTAGRGASDWLADPMLYGIPQYVADMVTLIARLDVEQVDWVGTSMGGLIGMALAAQPGTPIAKLVLNDAGPVVTKVSLERIATYVGMAPVFPDFATAVQYVRTVSASLSSTRATSERVTRTPGYTLNSGNSESIRSTRSSGRRNDTDTVFLAVMSGCLLSAVKRDGSSTRRGIFLWLHSRTRCGTL